MKRIIILLALLAFVAGLYAMSASAATVKPTATATATDTPESCNVQTGIEGGAVNLRACGGTSCGVLGIVTEGERLTILTAGNWINVMTKGGATGFINSKYCKGK